MILSQSKKILGQDYDKKGHSFRNFSVDELVGVNSHFLLNIERQHNKWLQQIWRLVFNSVGGYEFFRLFVNSLGVYSALPNS